jgi:excisionase family DNA binding protein
MLTVKQLSNLLNIKGSTLYAWVGGEKIPYIKIHGLVRFRQDEIDEWVKSFQKIPTTWLPKNLKRNGTRDFEDLFERTRRDVYNSPLRGNQTKVRPEKGGRNYGPV